MMTLARKNYKKKILFKSIILVVLFLTVNYSLFYSCFETKNYLKPLMNNENISIPQSPVNDTDEPIITFVQPELNNTIIERSSYTFIVSIIDDNPPLFGNVTFQLSNSTQNFFNASMNYDGESRWSFYWNNITSYPNRFYSMYLLQIWAIDNSSNHNIGSSEVFYIYLNLPGESPGVINVIIYLIVVSIIIAGIVVYLNKKLLPKSADRKGMEIDEI
jgi:hypothetical protein